ncbi:MAG: L,D-transpeptidase family protein [Lentisphaerae bacterium]|nr:L,D-transpeptidase family protein [Lentisphaerota bacterium]
MGRRLVTMDEMTVKDFDDFKPPRRRPWILFALGLALIAFAIHYFVPKRAKNLESDKKVATDVEPVAIAEQTAMSAQMAQPSKSPDPDPVLKSLTMAAALEKDGELVMARKIYLSLLDSVSNVTTRATIEQELGDINVRLVTTPMAMPEKVEYVIQRGDMAEKIARRFGTTVELLQLSNDIRNPNIIRLGDRWRVLNAKFAIKASRKNKLLTLYMNERFFKVYSVGVGKYGKTPIGTFVISERIREPVWWRPDGKEVPYGSPENILGTHWLTLRASGDTPDVRGYGIHGTWDDASIGKEESAGCLRMHNKDVAELYTIIPTGTPVTIAE